MPVAATLADKLALWDAFHRVIIRRVNICSSYLQVNKIREVPHHESVIVTHTDSPEVYVWSLERQPNRASDKVCAHSHMRSAAGAAKPRAKPLLTQQ